MKKLKKIFQTFFYPLKILSLSEKLIFLLINYGLGQPFKFKYASPQF